MSPTDGVLHPFLHLDGAKLRRIFHPCKRFPTWRGPVSGLPCSRAVPTCVHARMRIEGNAEHLPSRGPGDGVKHPPFCYPTGKNLLPSWAAIFLQLGSSATLFYALSVPCVPRSVDAIWGVRLLFYLLINRSYIPILSLHRAREMN